jgi:DNA invertase Pin-like site-specific DNA recombinase
VRVSTGEQRTDLQRDEGAARIRDRGWRLVERYEDRGVSGTRASRPELDRMLADARARRFDVLVVWKADRLFRSLVHMVATLEELGALGIDFVSCTESFDTSTPQGRLLFHLVSAFAQFERDVLVERTRAGMAAARRRGSRIGRAPRYVNVERGRDLLASGYSQRAAAAELGVGLGTFQRAIARGGA